MEKHDMLEGGGLHLKKNTDVEIRIKKASVHRPHLNTQLVHKHISINPMFIN